MASTSPLRAAGGVVWRASGEGGPEVAVVHRPRYGDWSLPKGKLRDGETDIDAAVREVSEEIGASVVVSRRLGKVRYDVAGQRKTVLFWAMRYVGGQFVASDEVDDVVWLPVPAARERLTYDTDRSMLDAFVELPVPESTVVLVRHARAGKRSEWRGADSDRPLDPNGQRQARGLIRFLGYFAPDEVLSADRVRCIETVRPFAEAAGLPLQVDPAFNDESYLDSPGASMTAVLSLAKPGRCAVVCSQGLTIPSLIDRLGPGIIDSTTRKGSAWVLSIVDGDVIGADRYDDAAGITS